MTLDIGLITVVLTLGMAPIVLALFQKLAFRVLAIVVVASLSTGVACYVDDQWDYPLTEEEIDFRPVENPKNNYTGSNSCRSCHPDQYDSWHRSYHRTMTQPATPENVIGNFDNVTVEAYGEEYRLTRDGDTFWADSPDWKKPKVNGKYPRVRNQMVMLTGSHHMQVYWYNDKKAGRGLLHFDLVYVKETEEWVPRLATFITPPTRDSNPGTMGSARWEEACIPCHVTDGQPKIHRTKGHSDARMAEFGIACEACHGEAREHVNNMMNPLNRYAEHFSNGEVGIVKNPETLNPRKSSQVCGQCHSLRSFQTGKQQIQWKHGGGDPYRPGDDLEDTELVFQLPHPDPKLRAIENYIVKDLPGFTSGSFWPDGMVRVVGREYNMLLKSPCYDEAETEKPFTCMSCHSMHASQQTREERGLDEWADDQLKPGMRTNEACFQCHEDMRATLTEHTNHKADSSGSLCYNCHMPPTTYGLYKSVLSHQINVPKAQETLNTGRNNACNNCHIDKKLQWAADKLTEWYGHPTPVIHPDLDEAALNVVLLLQGDAAQRALAAWAMGWEPAIQASGDDWQAPILAELLDDPYYAVRFITHRSMKRFSPFENLEYNFTDTEEELLKAQEAVRATWFEEPGRNQDHRNPDVLTNPDGSLIMETLTNILSRRDDAPIDIAE